MSLRLHRVKTVAFGFLDTLVNVRAGMKTSLLDVEGKRRGQLDLDEMARVWEQELILYYREAYEPWPINVLDALEATCEQFDIPFPLFDQDRVIDWVVRWPYYDDHYAISKVGRRFKVAIVSQLDNASLAACVPNLARQPEYVVTTDLSRAYKPDPGYFRLLRVQLRLEEPEELLIISANAQVDLEPAAEFGFQTLHVDRTGASEGENPRDLLEAVAQLA
jgi:2-haloacid dehalogenase